MKLRGNDMTVMVYVNGKWRAIAYATTCELDINADTLEVGSALNGKWRESKKRKLSWSGTTGHLMADVKQQVDILGLVMSMEPVQVCFGTVKSASATSAENLALDGRLKLSGKAYVTRATISARRGDMVTISAAFEGTGELTTEWGK